MFKHLTHLTPRNIIFAGVGMLLLLVVVWLMIEPRIRAAQFCTEGDEVYQAIVENIDSWLAYFPNSDSALYFKTPSGREYLVSSVYWRTKDQSPLLFIPTETKVKELLGYRGYIYSPAGPSAPDGRYQTKHLTGDIYCYQFAPKS
jgi:hypothetical protein